MRRTVLASLLLSWAAAPLHAAVLNVPVPYTTIQGAIDAAAGSGDTVLVAPGIYAENIDFKGKAVAVQSSGGAALTVIDGGQLGPVVTFASGEGAAAVLDGFTVTNGLAGCGGGVYCYQASPTLRANVITGNVATADGGGVYCFQAAPLIDGNEISGNHANWGGGIGCFDNSSPQIRDNLIKSNASVDLGAGIALYISSHPAITGNTIESNSGGSGGGIGCAASSMPDVRDNLVADNTALYNGGGLYSTDYANPTIAGNTFRKNNAINHTGGGVHAGTAATITGNTFEENDAVRGGGVAVTGPFAHVIEGNLFLKNTAWDGGGLSCEFGSCAEVTGNTFQQNSVPSSGGGFSCFALGTNPLVRGNLFLANQAYNGAAIAVSDNALPEITENEVKNNVAGGGGGGIWLWFASPAIAQNEITGNQAQFGAGILCDDGAASLIEENLIEQNTSAVAYGEGGGICIFGGASPTISGNRILDNASDWGGGVNCANTAPVLIVNNLIAGNSTISFGGGVRAAALSTVTLVNNTIADNSADGIDVENSSIVTMANNIVWDNTPQEIVVAPGTPQPAVTYCDVKGGWAGVGNMNNNPQFVDQPAADYHITYPSPCRESGVVCPGLPAEDFEGDPRPAGAAVDMGADEFHAHLYSTGSATPGGLVHLKVVGAPGTTPVALFVALAAYETPVPSAYGAWYLMNPILGPLMLPPLNADGLQVISAYLPASVPAPYDVCLQVLMGSPLALTNLWVMEVR